MNVLLNKLINENYNFASHLAAKMNPIGPQNHVGYQETINNIKSEIKNLKDVELGKALAIKFDGDNDMAELEDVLINLMGEEAYDDFADENDLA